LIVPISVKIFAMAEEVPRPKLIEKDSPLAWILIGVVALVVLAIGIFIGMKLQQFRQSKIMEV